MKRHLFRRIGRFLRPQAPSLAGAAALAALSGLLALLVPLLISLPQNLHPEYLLCY